MRTVVVGCLVLAACGTAPTASPPKAKAAVTQAVDLARASCSRRTDGALPERLTDARQGSAVALVRSHRGLLAYVADADSRSLHTVSVDEKRELVRTRLNGVPRELLVLPDGRVAVALSDGTQVAIFEPAANAELPLASLCERHVPPEPWGLALSPSDRKLVVTSGWGSALTIFDAATLAVERVVSLPRDPRAVLVDGSDTAFVSHLVGAKVSAVDLKADASKPTVVDLGVRKSTPRAELNDMLALRAGSQGYSLAKVALPLKVAGSVGVERILLPMVSVDPGDPLRERAVYYGPPFDGVPKETPIVSVVDPANKQALTKYLLGATEARFARECLLPRAAAVRAATGSLLVLCFGIDAVVELDALAIDPFRAERSRTSVPPGPSGVAVDDASGRAVVFSQLGGALTVIRFDGKVTSEATIDLDYHPDLALAAAAKGRLLFYRTDDRRISGDGLGCSSCHIDGRDDAITWSTR
jgi:DNA-binding beta-propeller fold protein YncE